MVWQKQNSFKNGKKIDKTDKIENSITSEFLRNKFLEDWENCRDRHSGQKQILKATFEDRFKYIFYRAGRKGSKTTTAIDIAWLMANEMNQRVIYLCYPTIAQGIEVVWEERRLQTCDLKNDSMYDKYVEKTDDSRHILWFANGSFVKLIGTWTEARGRGTQPDCLIIDEFQDCNPDYIEAMDPNLAAKNAPCILMGTPPKNRNHYEEWWERISQNPKGKTFHFTSYDNDRLPHLKEWLDNKKIELIKANKEDVWLREYMAEFCYVSSDRVLPDVKFYEKQEILQKLSQKPYIERIPILAISVHKTYFNSMVAVLLRNSAIFIIDHVHVPQVWNKSFKEMYPLLAEKIKEVQELCGKKMRSIVWDESESFSDVIEGFTKCRSDLKWQDRGIPLLREMMTRDKIFFCRDVGEIGLECQNLLVEENKKDIEKNYPNVCTVSMMVNEYFSQERFKVPLVKPFDKYQGLREMGIPAPPAKYKRFLKI